MELTDVQLDKLVNNFWSDPIGLNRELETLSISTQNRDKAVNTVAVFYHSLAMGGGERMVQSLADLWQSMGKRVVVITNSETGGAEIPLPAGVTHVVIPTFVGISKDSYPARKNALLEVLQAEHVDAFVFGHWFSDCLAFDMLTVRLLGISCYLYVQSSFTFFFLDSDLPPSYAYIPLWYRLADGVACLSTMDAHFWSHFNSNVRQTNNLLTAKRPDLPAPLSGHSVLWPARLHRDKNPERIVPILRELVKLVPDVTFNLVGPIDDRYRNLVEQDAATDGLLQHIVFHGPQSTDAMSAFYEHADAYLLTSKREGWSLALAEALAHGVPCIIYDLPYLTLAQKESGVISVPQDNAKEAARALAGVLLDKERAHALGALGRNFITKLSEYDYAGFWGRFLESQQNEPHDACNGVNRIMWVQLLSSYSQHIASLLSEWAAAQLQCDSYERRIEELQTLAETETSRNRELESELKNRQEECEALRASKSYRIGNAIIRPLKSAANAFNKK